MRDPDASRNFFPDSEANVKMYKQFAKKNVQYISDAITHTEAQPNLEAPWRDNGEPLHDIDL